MAIDGKKRRQQARRAARLVGVVFGRTAWRLSPVGFVFPAEFRMEGGVILLDNSMVGVQCPPDQRAGCLSAG